MSLVLGIYAPLNQTDEFVIASLFVLTTLNLLACSLWSHSCGFLQYQLQKRPLNCMSCYIFRSQYMGAGTFIQQISKAIVKKKLSLFISYTKMLDQSPQCTDSNLCYQLNWCLSPYLSILLRQLALLCKTDSFTVLQNWIWISFSCIRSLWRARC